MPRITSGAGRAPHRRHTLDGMRRVFRQRTQHDVAADVQVGQRGLDAARLAPGDWMPRHELPDARAERRTRRGRRRRTWCCRHRSRWCCASRNGAMRSSSGWVCATGAASSTKSAPRERRCATRGRRQCEAARVDHAAVPAPARLDCSRTARRPITVLARRLRRARAARAQAIRRSGRHRKSPACQKKTRPRRSHEKARRLPYRRGARVRIRRPDERRGFFRARR